MCRGCDDLFVYFKETDKKVIKTTFNTPPNPGQRTERTQTMSGDFDILNMIDPSQIGQSVSRWGTTPLITFDGGDTLHGWVHERFFLTGQGLRFEAWESGGLQQSYNQPERSTSLEELRGRVLLGDIPLAAWSNAQGLALLNTLMNKVSEEEMIVRIRQVRDALNKCRNIVTIEAAARLFGI